MVSRFLIVSALTLASIAPAVYSASKPAPVTVPAARLESAVYYPSANKRIEVAPVVDHYYVEHGRRYYYHRHRHARRRTGLRIGAGAAGGALIGAVVGGGPGAAIGAVAGAGAGALYDRHERHKGR